MENVVGVHFNDGHFAQAFGASPVPRGTIAIITLKEHRGFIEGIRGCEPTKPSPLLFEFYPALLPQGLVGELRGPSAKNFIALHKSKVYISEIVFFVTAA